MPEGVPKALPFLAGRENELAALSELLDEVSAGSFAVVVVTGGAGMGKSRLCERFAAEASRSNARSLVGMCSPQWGEDMAFAAFVGGWRDAGFSQLILDASRLGSVPGSVARAWLFDKVHANLVRLAAAQPIVGIVEDLHWADRSTLSLLHFLARSCRPARVLVVATMRQEAGERLSDAQESVCELGDLGHGQRIRLGPLDDSAVRAIAMSVTERVPGEMELHELVRRADGSPYFAAELARASADANAVMPVVPDTLRELLLRRVRGLSPAGQRALSVVALAGRHASVDLVVDIVGPDASEALRAAQRGGLVAASSEGLTMAHVLLRDVLLEELTAVERRDLHRDIARRCSAADHASLAHHWHLAGETTEAFTHWVVAAGEAAAANAFDEAVRGYDFALDLSQQLGRIDIDLPSIAIAVAAPLESTGRGRDAAALLERALAVTPSTASDTRAALLDRLYECLYALGDSNSAFARLAQACELVPHITDPRLAAQIVVADAGRLMVEGRLAAAMHRAREASALVGAIPAPVLTARAEMLIGVCAGLRGDIEAGLARVREAAILAEQSGDLAMIARAAVNISFVLYNASRYSECVGAARDAIAQLSERGVAGSLGAALHFNCAVSYLALGQWSDVLAEVHRATANGVRERTRRFLELCTAQVHALQGELDAAQRIVGDARRGDDTAASALFDCELVYTTSLVARLSGRHREAALVCTEALDALRDRVQGTDVLRLVVLALGSLADLEARGGRIRKLDRPKQRAEELLARALDAMTQWEGTVALPEPAALLAQCEAEHARLVTADPARWFDVAQRWMAIDVPYNVAYAHLRRADALLSVRDHSAAAESLQSALSIAEQLGARPLAGEIERVARRGRLPLTTSWTADHDVRLKDTLTTREREVLALLALGRTNRQVATELYISERTAAVHVSHILTKLAAANRSEAVRIAREMLHDRK